MTDKKPWFGPRTKRWALITVGVLLIAAILGRGYLREGRAWYYGLQAYLYGFPLVVMDLTKDQGTAAATAGEITAPINQFAVMTKYPDASFRAVPRTGLDTLFATAWADLDKEPLVLSVPDTNGRYYVIALFDMWSNVFTSIGKRTTGTGAANFLIAGPRWRGTPPAGVKEVFRSPTRFVWVNGQMQANGPQDYDEVNALQTQYTLTPLSAWGQPYAPPAEVPVPAGIDTKTPPTEQVAKMDAGAFFGRVARLMKDNPPAPADAPVVEKLSAIGIEPGKDFDIKTIDPYVARGLQRAMGAFGLLQKGVTKLTTENGWIVIPKDFANYGTDYETRAGIALIGLGGIWPEGRGRTPRRSSTVTTSPSMPPTGTCCTSTRARRRPPMSPGRCPCTTRRATTCRTRSTATTWRRGCRFSTTRTVRSTSTSRRTLRARARRPTGCLRPRAGRST